MKGIQLYYYFNQTKHNKTQTQQNTNTTKHKHIVYLFNMRLHLTDALCEYTENHILSFLNEKDKISTWRTSKHYYMIQHLKWLKIKQTYDICKKEFSTIAKALEDILYKSSDDFVNIRTKVEYMIKSGLWNLNEANKSTNRIPLYISSRKNNMYFTKMLLDYGADINGKINQTFNENIVTQSNCLYWCCISHNRIDNDMTKMIQYLLDNGIDMYHRTNVYPRQASRNNIKDPECDIFSHLISNTNYHTCKNQTEIIRMLLKNGYDIHKYKGSYKPYENRLHIHNEVNIFKVLLYNLSNNSTCKELHKEIDGLFKLIQKKYPDYFELFRMIDSLDNRIKIQTKLASLIFKYKPSSKLAFSMFYKKPTSGILRLLLKKGYLETTNELYHVIITQQKRQKNSLMNLIDRHGSFDERQVFHYHEKIKKVKKNKEKVKKNKEKVKKTKKK